MSTISPLPQHNPDTQIDLLPLLGSRICHDLISPIGAIGNGLELLSLSGVNETPELSLIRSSLHSANSRIRFFRIAFGNAPDGQEVSNHEIQSIIADYCASARTNITWSPQSNVSRPLVKLSFLSILCLEHAMPFGGEITVSNSGVHWQISGQADKLRVVTPCWEILKNDEAPQALEAPEIQFALLRNAAWTSGHPLTCTITDARVEISF